ncbi:MAG TPA: hypothetical protein PLU17_07410, partial [Chitinophagaceae bacterium]|nr:hypothetical protein [Chitinophagaceae bacterium]
MLSAGNIKVALIANANAPQGNILKTTVTLLIPPYMSAFNSPSDDQEISQTQTFFTGYTLSSAGVIMGSKIFCANGDADEFISVTPASGGQSGNFYYQWQEKIGPDWIDIPGATNLTYDAPNTFSSRYYRRNAKGTLCDNWLSTDSVTVIIDSLPIIGVQAGNNISLNCVNTSQQIGSLPITGQLYSWLPANGLNNNTIAQPIASPSISTTYTLTVVDSNQCIATDTIRINVNNIAQTINAGSDEYLTCVVTSTTIGPSNDSSISYSWSPPIGLSATNIAQPLATPNSTTTYTLQIVDSNGCETHDEITVFVNNIAQIANAGPDINLNCNLTEATLGGNSISGTNYLWTPAIGLSANNIAHPIVSPNSNTIYTLTTSDSNGCIATDIVSVSIDTIPPIANAGLDKNLDCNT